MAHRGKEGILRMVCLDGFFLGKPKFLVLILDRVQEIPFRGNVKELKYVASGKEASLKEI